MERHCEQASASAPAGLAGMEALLNGTGGAGGAAGADKLKQGYNWESTPLPMVQATIEAVALVVKEVRVLEARI